MLPANGWAFLSALLIVLAGVYLLFPSSFYLHFPRRSGQTTPMTLLCLGGSGARCCAKDHSQYTSGLALTIDPDAKRVIVFLEGNGSATGDIIELEESHLLFGKKSCDVSTPTGDSTGVHTGADTNTSTGSNTGTNTGVPAGANTSANTGTSADTSRDTSRDTNTDTNTSTVTGNNTGTDPPPPTPPPIGGACIIASGEINRLTGLADIRVKDGTGQTVAQWNKIQCTPKWQKF